MSMSIQFLSSETLSEKCPISSNGLTLLTLNKRRLSAEVHVHVHVHVVATLAVVLNIVEGVKLHVLSVHLYLWQLVLFRLIFLDVSCTLSYMYMTQKWGGCILPSKRKGKEETGKPKRSVLAKEGRGESQDTLKPKRARLYLWIEIVPSIRVIHVNVSPDHISILAVM